jgi:uncharacterized repeat protein (TIGR03803 family)
LVNARRVPMKKSIARILVPLVSLTLVVLSANASAPAQTYADLYNFILTYGADPRGVLAQGRDGNLYSTTVTGGNSRSGQCQPSECGVLFQVTPTGTYSDLFNFDYQHGSAPFGGVTLGTDGRFYGTTNEGGSGYGTIFRYATNGRGLSLYIFNGVPAEGGNPSSPPIEGGDGNFYGVTSKFSDFPGVSYRISPTGTFAAIGQIPGYSDAPLLLASDGNFYGTTYPTPNEGESSVFRMTTDGVASVIHKFNGGDGKDPLSPVIQASDGVLYGTTSTGGHGNGVVFRLTLQGAFSVLHYFGDIRNDGTAPHAGLVQATDGNIYGVTSGGGTSGKGVIFRITQKGIYSILYNFDGMHGSAPYSTPVQHTNGKIYGLASAGGTSGNGVVYSFDLGLGPFVKLVSIEGRVGRTGGILGQGFTGTTNVSLNGTSAAFTVVSDTYLTATVPPGATSGYVTVTTPNGTLASNVPFRVVP